MLRDLLTLGLLRIFAVKLNISPMKLLVKNLKIFSIGILLIIFSLQTVWLYQTFLLTKENLIKQVTQEFISSIQKEVDFQESKRREIKVGKTFTFDSEADISSFPINIILLEAQYFYNTPPLIANVDSLLSNALKEKNIKGDFVINRINTLDDTVIESTAPETESQWRESLKTEEIPMRLDKSESFQLLLLNPNWSIFIQMAYIILLSALVVFLVTMGLWWQYKNYLEEKKIRRFQKNHANALVHNMATPLQTIHIINSTLLENSITEPEKQKKFLTIQQNQIKNLQNQVNRILLVSRANISGIKLSKATVDIEEFVSEVCEPFGRERKKEIHIERHFTLSERTISVDKQLFSDVLNNLIENAIKYSGAKVNIEVATELTSEELLVEVKDDGFGIALKDQEFVFERFNRGAAAFRDGVTGFGIGLSFVKVVVEAHGGTVSLFSKGEKQGTTFTIRIPRVA